jgi:ketosteroid isomerase-like protein
LKKTALNKQIALKWINAFNEHDLKKLLKLYSEDAIHFSPKLKIIHPETEGWIMGKAALEKWWGDAFKKLPSLNYQLENLVISDDQILMEYLRKTSGEPDMMIAEILEISNKKIVKSRVYHS